MSVRISLLIRELLYLLDKRAIGTNPEPLFPDCSSPGPIPRGAVGIREQ